MADKILTGYKVAVGLGLALVLLFALLAGFCFMQPNQPEPPTPTAAVAS